jgi:hypothetical protein
MEPTRIGKITPVSLLAGQPANKSDARIHPVHWLGFADRALRRMAQDTSSAAANDNERSIARPGDLRVVGA